MAETIRRCIVCRALLDATYFTRNGYVRIAWHPNRQRPGDDEGWVCDDDLDMLAQILHVNVGA